MVQVIIDLINILFKWKLSKKDEVIVGNSIYSQLNDKTQVQIANKILKSLVF